MGVISEYDHSKKFINILLAQLSNCRPSVSLVDKIFNYLNSINFQFENKSVTLMIKSIGKLTLNYPKFTRISCF